MQTILSDGYELDGATDPVTPIDVAAAMPAGIEYYVITLIAASGGSPVSLIEGDDTQADPLKCAQRVQEYPVTFGPYKISRGNPSLIISESGTASGAYTVCALSDGMVDYGR